MADGTEIRTGGWASSGLGAAISAAVVLGALALVVFVNLRTEPLGRISEVRCIRVVTGMLESGDWLVPRLGPTLRLQKPPLFYWAGATNATLLGDSGAFPVRLTSALSALGLVALVMVWGRSLGGPGAGVAAGAALAAMYQLTASGRRGDAEMLLALLCVASLLVFDRLHGSGRRALLPLFGALAGLAILAKATAVILVVALPILVFLGLQRELPRLRDRGAIGACALALAIGLSWYVALLARVPEAAVTFWNSLTLPLGADRVNDGNAAHFKSVLWYFSILPVRAAPASLLLPVVIWRLWTTGVYRGEPRKRFAALTFLVPFVAFSLLPQKQKHYTLVMLPPGLALLTADAVFALAPHARALLARAVGAPLALAGIAATVIFSLFLVWVDGLSQIGVGTAAALLAGLFALAVAAALRGSLAGFACAFLPAFLLLLTLQRSIVVVRVEQMASAGLRGLTLDERERLYRVAREQPWFFDLFQPVRWKESPD